MINVREGTHHIERPFVVVSLVMRGMVLEINLLEPAPEPSRHEHPQDLVLCAFDVQLEDVEVPRGEVLHEELYDIDGADSEG